MAKRRIMSSLGGKATDAVPESRVHRDPAAADPYGLVRHCHVGGVPVATLPEAVIARLSYEMTDEGIEERNKGKVPAAARVTRDPVQKSIEQRADELEAGFDPGFAADPLRDAARAAADDGQVDPDGNILRDGQLMRAKFLSPAVCDKKGLRGFALDGAKTVGKLMLGLMPAARAEKRNQHFREQGAIALTREQDSYREEHERLQRETGGSPRGRKSGLPDPLEGLQESQGAQILR